MCCNDAALVWTRFATQVLHIGLLWHWFGPGFPYRCYMIQQYILCFPAKMQMLSAHAVFYYQHVNRWFCGNLHCMPYMWSFLTVIGLWNWSVYSCLKFINLILSLATVSLRKKIDMDHAENWAYLPSLLLSWNCPETIQPRSPTEVLCTRLY